MKYHFKIHKEGDGFWAQCIEIPGCITQGDTREELYENMQDALNTIIYEPSSSKDLVSLPKKIKKARNIIEVPVDDKIAFGFTLRYHRIKNGLTQKQAAKLIGVDNLYSYQRLEKKSNVTLEIISRLMSAFPELSVDGILK